jgi:hypothetical protein
MKSPSDSYSLDHACDEIAGVDIYTDSAGQLRFARAVIRLLSDELRKDRGIDLGTLIAEEEANEFCRLALSQHGQLPHDMALIVATTALKIEVNRHLAKSNGRK